MVDWTQFKMDNVGCSLKFKEAEDEESKEYNRADHSSSPFARLL